MSWDFGIGSSDNLVEKGRDRKWWFFWNASLFYVALLCSRYVWISIKSKISFKRGPTLKALMIHDDYALYLWFNRNDLQNWFMTYQWLELRWNTSMCENYTPLRGFPLFVWIRCFLLCSLETKCELILILVGFVNFIFVFSFLMVVFLKNVVLINLEVDSLQSMLCPRFFFI